LERVLTDRISEPFEDWLTSAASVDDGQPMWLSQFEIQSTADLDFVISQDFGRPVGMTRASPPEFRRRILAAAISYQLGLRSIDYTLKRYVRPDTYVIEEVGLGDTVSDFLRDSLELLTSELRDLHTQINLTFGIFGAEITLFKVPESLDMARMLANRGLFLEVLPILRLCLEMMAWSATAYYLKDEDKVMRLKAQGCISRMKPIYESTGRMYGYLSKFAHWDYAIHSHFLNLSRERTFVVHASRRYRATSLTLCLLVLDVFVEVVRQLYAVKATRLITAVQGTFDRVPLRKVHMLVSLIAENSKEEYFAGLKSLLC
jgi:hypothetical protein